MRVGMCGVAVLIGAMGIVSDVTAAENNSSLAPLTPMVADASASQNTTPQYDRVIGVCHLSENPFDPTSAVNSMTPAIAIKNYYRVQEQFKIEGQPSISVLQMPAHGTLEDVGKGSFAYYPEKGYLGNDRASLLVEMGGKKIRMEYFFRVMQQVPDQEGIDPYADNCPNKVRVWKISSVTDANGNNTLVALELGAAASGTVESSTTGMN